MQREAIDNILVFTLTNKINGFIAVYVFQKLLSQLFSVYMEQLDKHIFIDG